MATIPIYRLSATNPTSYKRYRYSSNAALPGWAFDRIAFYAFSDGSAEGAVPIYELSANDGSGNLRYYYSTSQANQFGWSNGTLAFYAYPAGSTAAGARPIYSYSQTPPSLGGWVYGFSANPSISGWSLNGEAFRVPSDITINVMAVRNTTPAGGWTTTFQPSNVTMPYPGRLVFIPVSAGWTFPANSFRIVSSDNPQGNADFSPQALLGNALYVGDSESDPGQYSYCLTLIDSSTNQPFDADPQVRNTEPDAL
jgi:hypothetical protein